MQGQEGEHGIPRSTERYFAGIRHPRRPGAGTRPNAATHAFGAGTPPISAPLPPPYTNSSGGASSKYCLKAVLLWDFIYASSGVI